MPIWNRLRRLVTADAHGVIDALEDTALLLKQCQRDAETALAEKSARLTVLDGDVKRLGESLTRTDARITALDEDVELALAAGEDELARFAVKRLLPLRREHTSLTERIEIARADRAELARIVEEQTAALAELEVRIAQRLADIERDEVHRAPPTAEEEIDLELLRRRRAAGGV